MNMHAKIATATATLSHLHPGQEYPDGNINARTHYTQDEIEELAASLKGPDGQLRPMLVATHPKKPGAFFVFGGGRRRIAYQLLIDRGELPEDHPIEIRNFGQISVDEALSKSLADNAAVPMHPADQAATFARLAKDRAPEEIAKDRGMTLRAVQQSIALGTALIPGFIAMWREGTLSRENVEQLTTATEEQQTELLARIKDRDFNPAYTRDWEEFRQQVTAGKAEEMRRLLGFVGVQEAKAAGVPVTEDFFGEGGVVKDLKALNKVAAAKMKTLIQAELDAGWNWCDGKLSAARGMHHGFGEVKAKPTYTPEEKKRLAAIEGRLKQLHDIDMTNDAEDREEDALMQEQNDIETIATNRAYTAKQMAGAGVVIRLRADGKPDYKRGLIRKVEGKKKSPNMGGPANYAQREPEPLDWKVRRALEGWQDQAAGELLLKHPKAAFAAMVAAIMTGDYSAPVRIDHVVGYNRKSGSKPFDANFAAASKMTLEQVANQLAPIVCRHIEVATNNGQQRKPSWSTLLRTVGEKEFAAALAKKFDPKVYFGGASKKHMLGVTAEAFGAAARKAADGKGDEALRKELIGTIAKTGWLPPELRTKAYSGPSAKNPAKAKAEALDQARKAVAPAKKKSK